MQIKSFYKSLRDKRRILNCDYPDNILVQESTVHFLEDELGWEVNFSYYAEVLGNFGALGHRGYKEILSTRYFREAPKRFNLWLTDN